MNAFFLKSPAGSTSLPVFTLILALFAGFGVGYQTANDHRSQLSAAPRNRVVSEKIWVPAEQIRGRYSFAKHEEFMRRAIKNSRTSGLTKRTGGPVGAVIVDREGRVIADGFNQVVANSDPLCHAEMNAIQAACARLNKLKLDGCVLYSSAEPCPMCLGTAYWAGLDGIIYGAFASDAKKYGGFDDAFIHEEFAKPADKRKIPQIPLLRDEAVKVWEEYASLPDNVPY
jgi:tRNA(Arg) A34 adenosine deaminase TadA